MALIASSADKCRFFIRFFMESSLLVAAFSSALTLAASAILIYTSLEINSFSKNNLNMRGELLWQGGCCPLLRWMC